ncbi:MAG: SpoIIE family protein phosphatase [Fuerstiella sp.]|nr:SpoIIE family protein phosphatase [Fuerstiella sp.]
MARLVLLLDGKATPYELTRLPVQLGRHPDCDVHLDSGMVSRFHARLVRDQNRYLLEDLGSGNGSFLNGRQLDPNTPQELRNGDRIKLGPMKLRFEKDVSNQVGTDTFELTTGLELSDYDTSTIMGSADASGYGFLEVRPEDKLRGILKINEALSRTVELTNIAPKILDTLFDIFPQADRGMILIKDDSAAPLIPVAQKHRNDSIDESVRMSRTILDRVLNDCSGILSADAASDSRFSASESISSLTIHSMMCVPLLNLEDDPFGVISLDTQNPLKRFTEDDLQLLLAVATQAAHSYENTRLLVSHVEKQKQDKEMVIARNVQRALLPDRLPEVDGYCFYASYDSAQAVGGDYFDCFQISDTKVCVAFGDVAGKGVPGALIMSRISSVVQNTLSFTDDVSLAVRRINDHMCHKMVEGRFVTFIIGVLDLKKNTFTFANAGHMSPLIRHNSGVVSEVDDASIGIPVGIMQDYPYEVEKHQIEPGDTWVLITDGVDEAMDPDSNLYSKDRVRRFVGSNQHTPEELCRALLTDVRTHAAGRAQNDDITIMVFGRNG